MFERVLNTPLQNTPVTDVKLAIDYIQFAHIMPDANTLMLSR